MAGTPGVIQAEAIANAQKHRNAQNGTSGVKTIAENLTNAELNSAGLVP
jgi:hypothetical protein